MASGRILVVGVILAAASACAYFLLQPKPATPISAVVRTTEVRIAPEIGGELVSVNVRKGDTVPGW